jgi:hypothetical protein
VRLAAFGISGFADLDSWAASIAGPLATAYDFHPAPPVRGGLAGNQRPFSGFEQDGSFAPSNEIVKVGPADPVRGTELGD